MKKLSITSMLAALLIGGCASETTETTRISANPDRSSESETPQPRGDVIEDVGDYALNAEKYYDNGDYARALTQFLKYKEKDPKSWGAALGIGYCYLNLGLGLAADSRLEDAFGQFKKAEVAFTGQWDGTVEKSAADAKAFQWKACMGLALTERALGNLESLFIRGIESRATIERGSQTLQQEISERSRKRTDYYQRSLAKFRKLITMEAPPPDAFLNAGDLEMVVNGPVRAEPAYLAYLEVAKESVESWKRRQRESVETFKDRRSFEEATFIIDKKLETATKKTVDVMIQLALINYTTGRYAESLQFLLDAQKLDPTRQSLHLNVAECYDKLGNQKEALKRIDEFLTLAVDGDPNVRRAYKLRSEITKRQSN
jgi:tetratricopeptide (TPR) repeat protein